jgi:hypothetical protein
VESADYWIGEVGGGAGRGGKVPCSFHFDGRKQYGGRKDEDGDNV